MRLHILGIPHTKTTTEFTTCAFTMKVYNLCKMMTRLGHTVYHYGVEGSDPECTEHISVVSSDEWSELYSHPGTNFYDLSVDGKYAPYHVKWAERCNKHIEARMGGDYEDIICLTWGGTQRDACKDINQFQVESGIGYKNSWSDYRVYESYAWMHMQLGQAGLLQGGKFYWSVIPNAFDLSMFDFREKRGEDFLYIGRLNDDKGVALAIEIAKEVKCKIKIVGQGDPTRFLAGNERVEYIKPVGIEGRRKLLREAKAVICPTLYVEPFGGVNVEAQLSGAPVITTDWGAFTETVLHGITGYRCRTFEQFVWAAKNIGNIDPNACHKWASSNYSLERVALMYDEYFNSLLNLKYNGFYQENTGRSQLNWLRYQFPEETTKVNTNDIYNETKSVIKQTEWEKAQKYECCWWGLDRASHWEEEIKKQTVYFKLMGMPVNYDFGSKTVLDVGCGPVSLLQRSKHGRARGVDPLLISDKVKQLYIENNVEFLNIKAEHMPLETQFDEVWMYNCLQHVEDPDEILKRIATIGKEIRIFEWIDMPKYQGHPHTIKEEMFDKHFDQTKFRRLIWDVGMLNDTKLMLHGKYIAIHIKHIDN